MKYVQILKGTQRYHIFGTHMQSGKDKSDIKARKLQITLMKTTFNKQIMKTKYKRKKKITKLSIKKTEDYTFM